MGKAVGRKQHGLVHVLSHLQRFSYCLISLIIKLSLWVFQVDASQGLECSLTGRNQKQHVLVMLCQLWITRNVLRFALKIQMPSIASSLLLLPWANLIISHGESVCRVFCLICLYATLNQVSAALWNEISIALVIWNPEDNTEYILWLLGWFMLNSEQFEWLIAYS